MADYFVEFRNITKRYPGTVACNKISVGFKRGEVHAFLGENGAGKSTLMNILYGLVQPDEGEILIEGEKAVIHSPKDAISHGIGMVHQHFMLIPALTVVENIILGLDDSKSVFMDKEAVSGRIRELSEKYHMDVDPSAKVADLTVGQQQRVEIIKALYKECELLVLDEPTAVLTPQETKELFQVIRRFVAEDKAVIFITHKMNEVMEVSKKITVLRLGEVIGGVDTKDTNPKDLARMMVGKEVLFDVEKKEVKLGKVMLNVQDLEAVNSRGLKTVNGVNFSVRAGEVFGIAGVDGNGQSELIRGITGLCKHSGVVAMNSENLSSVDTRKILDQGVAHIPEDRQGMGVVMDMSIEENLILNTYRDKKFGKGIYLDWKAVKKYTDDLIVKYGIKTPNSKNDINSLSGGNQQKVVVARELDKEPKILFAIHPTRGVDVGATEFIHKKIIEEKEKGCAVVLVSTELDEIMSLSDRIGVIYEGRIVGVLDRKDANNEKIGLLMAGKVEDAGHCKA